MNAKRGIRFVLHPSAFTLIEMLTVIAIIGILAGILLPTLHMVKKKARITQAASDISALAQALTAYNADFGAFPPDSQDCFEDPSGTVYTAFEDLDNPNEIVVWFLTREYVRSGGAGEPKISETEWTVGPKDSLKINARITAPGSPYLDVPNKARSDYDQDDFYEFVDPWGRPYMYRAYLSPAQAINNILPPVYVDEDDPPDGIDDITIMTFELDVPAELQSMEGIRGKVRFGGFGTADDSFNNMFNFEGSGDFSVEITLTGIVSAPSLTADTEYQFCLHNPQTCDVYSLGPDGLTRRAQNPTDPGGATIEWKPKNWSTTTTWPYDDWAEVWGSPGDGNDIMTDGNIGIAEEKHRDDINNW